MLDWKLHLISGLMFVIVLLGIFNFTGFSLSIKDMVMVFLLSSFATLFPDVDMQKSKIRGLVSFMAAAAVSAAYVINYPQTWYYTPVYFSLLYFILKYLPSKHRGILHTFKFAVVFAAAFAVLIYFAFGLTNVRLVLYFAIPLLCYCLHLMLDRV